MGCLCQCFQIFKYNINCRDEYRTAKEDSSSIHHELYIRCLREQKEEQELVKAQGGKKKPTKKSSKKSTLSLPSLQVARTRAASNSSNGSVGTQEILSLLGMGAHKIYALLTLN